MKARFACVFLIVLNAYVHSEENPVENLLDAMEACYRKMGQNKTLIIEASNDDHTLKEGNPSVNDFFACTFRKAGLLLENGDLNTELLKKVVENSFETPQQIVDDGIEACKDVKGTCGGDTVVKVYNCLVKHGALK